MIETRESVNTNVTPKTITTSMIDADLKNGLNKRDMMEKYNIRKWEIDRIFKNPKLTGRRPSPKLSFTFVDDMDDVTTTPETTEEEYTDPNQVTIDQAIEETEEDSPTISQTAEDYGDADEDDDYISDETQDETVEDEDEFDSFEL